MLYFYEIFSVLQHKDERRRKDENILKQSHQLAAEMIEHGNFLHSLLVKTAIYGYLYFFLFKSYPSLLLIYYYSFFTGKPLIIQSSICGLNKVQKLMKNLYKTSLKKVNLSITAFLFLMSLIEIVFKLFQYYLVQYQRNLLILRIVEKTYSMKSKMALII